MRVMSVFFSIITAMVFPNQHLMVKFGSSIVPTRNISHCHSMIYNPGACNFIPFQKFLYKHLIYLNLCFMLNIFTFRMGSPSIFVYDCSNAGIIVSSFEQFAEQHEREYHEQVAAHGSSADLSPPS